MPSTLKSRYESEGFVVVPGLIPPGDIVELQKACDRVIAITRSGGWKYRRTVGKQSPPWADEDPDSWGVQHVMHPDLGEPAFARWYTSDALMRTVQELLDCKEDELQMGKWVFFFFRSRLLNRCRRAVQYSHQPRFAELCIRMASGWRRAWNRDSRGRTGCSGCPAILCRSFYHDHLGILC
jgi:hypothetical protein